MVEKKKRRRDTRVSDPPRIELQERDIDILEMVYRHRIMSQVQLTKVFFGAPTRAGERLRHLFDHHLLERLIFPVFVGRSPTLYLLGRKGAEILRKMRGYEDLNWYASSLQLTREKADHTLAINDVFLAVLFACRSFGYECDLWRTERELKADYDRVNIATSTGKRESVPVIPDSYFTVIAEKERYPFFLELDRGTMTLARFKDKVRACEAYYLSGQYTQRYERKSLRVLTVVSTEASDGGERRMLALKAATEDVTKARWFWFTTLHKVTPETIFSDPIWYQAGRKELQALITPA